MQSENPPSHLIFVFELGLTKRNTHWCSTVNFIFIKLYFLFERGERESTHMLLWREQCLAVVVSGESDGRQLAVVGAVAVVAAAVAVGHRLAGTLADRSSRKLLVCKA